MAEETRLFLLGGRDAAVVALAQTRDVRGQSVFQIEMTDFDK